MQASNTFKKSFLKLMLKGLGLDNVRSEMASAQERKRAIKLSADAAMALSRGRTKWSDALIKGLSTQQDKKKMNSSNNKWKVPTSRKILRRSLVIRSRRPKKKKKKNEEASAVSRRMVRLKRIIPGSESLDGLSLLGETLDYVIHLRAQVSLMHCLANALGAPNLKSQKSMHCEKENDQELARCDDHGEMGSGSRVSQPIEKAIDSNNPGS